MESSSSELAIAQWNVSQIPSMLDKVAIVTGANVGIGFHTALELARNDATVVLACRSASRAEAAIAEIKKEVPRALLVFLELDLSSLESVRSFAEAFKQQFDRLDVLVNNAGMMYPSQSHTQSGMETQFAVNHLGHFYLTHLLFDVLCATADGARIVNVSSFGHRLAPAPDFDTIATSTRGKWLYFQEYNISKLCNLLFTYELDRRLRGGKLVGKVLSVAAHPGVSATNLIPTAVLRFVPGFMQAPVGNLMDVMPYAQSAAQGAVPILYAATARSVQSGAYYGPCGFQNLWGRAPVKETSSTLSYSEELATQLWWTSEELAKCKFAVEGAKKYV
jgi:NAD(P)-dependent dehydrogenase (short-subunit alcohol dehydrogenase family)